MKAVMIGVDPHKASHTAVALDANERTLGEARVSSAPGQVAQLLAWAKGWPRRTWAVENASGLGHLLAQQLVARGERVLGALEPTGPVAAARKELAEQLLGDLCRLDDQMKQLRQRLAGVVAASGTTTTQVFGVGPVIAAMVVGFTGNVGRFPSRGHFAAYNATAPIEVSSGEKKLFRLSMKGNRQLNHAVHMVAVTQIRNLKTEGRAYYERKLAEGKTGKEALRALKRRVSDSLYAAMVADARRAGKASGPGGQTGNGSVACAAGLHPSEPALRPSHSRAKPKPRTALRAAHPARPAGTSRKTSRAS
jgi:hypothetical protein